MKNFIVFLSIVLFFAGNISASLFEKITLSEIEKQSDLIVEGSVNGIKSFWNIDKTMIYTKVTISIKKIEKGQFGADSLKLTLIGGRIGNKALIALGMPVFAPKEEVFLFLNKTNVGYLNFFLGKNTAEKLSKTYQVTGSGQGKFKITKDPNSGKKILKQDVGNMEFANSVSETIDLQNCSLEEMRAFLKKKK